MTTTAVGAGGAPLLPVRPSGRTDGEAGAVVRAIPPVRPTVDPLLPDLSRAGVELPSLLDQGADALVARDQPGSVALAELLERARGALVRGAPMEMLAALDSGWEGAARTESGWYFRAAALTLLGLPGEAERVLNQATSVREGSAALAFLQSVVRSTRGDGVGARAALAEALAQRPGAPLLRAWDAVLSARGGHLASAHALLSELDGGGPTDPVIAWARQAMMRASANEQRAMRIPDPATLSATASHPEASPRASEVAPTGASPSLDPVDAALRRLGGRLGEASRQDLDADVRRLMQSLSAAGSMQEAGRSERSHAVRVVLATLQELLGRASRDDGGVWPRPTGSTRIGADGPAPATGRALDAFADADGSWRFTPVSVRGVAPDAFASPDADGPTLRAAVLAALCTGRMADAEQLCAQARARESEPVVRVLQRLLEGAATRDRAASDRPATDAATLGGLSTARDDAVLLPLRFGLILLQQLSPRHEARSARGVSASEHATRTVGAVTREGSRTAPPGVQERAGRRLRRLLGMGGLLLAASALLVGNGPVAIVLAGGAVWLLLR